MPVKKVVGCQARALQQTPSRLAAGLLSAHPSRRAAPLPRGRSEKGARMATMEIRVANKYRLGRKISNTLLYTHNSHDT